MVAGEGLRSQLLLGPPNLLQGRQEREQTVAVKKKTRNEGRTTQTKGRGGTPNPPRQGFCGCPKQGVKDLTFKERVSSRTFVTRPAVDGSDAQLGICLMPSVGGALTSIKGPRLCGHICCEDCLVLTPVPMCKCCSRKERNRTGQTTSWGGKLPQRSPTPPRPEPTSETKPGQGAPPPKDPAVPDLTPRRDRSPEEPVEPRGDERRRDPPKRTKTPEAKRRKERKGRKEQDEFPEGEGGPASSSRRARTPSPGPALRRDNAEAWAKVLAYSGQSATPRHEDRGRRDDPPAVSPGRAEPEPRRRRRRQRSPSLQSNHPPSEEMEEVSVDEDYECLRCRRRAARGRDYCCHLCEETKGRRHTDQCDEDNSPGSPPPDDSPRGGKGGGDDKDPDGGGKKGKGKKGNRGKGQGGKGKGWGRGARRPSKKDRDRWKRYAGKQRPAARYGGDLLARFHGARKLEAAPSTVRSQQARLKTWDRVVDELVARELAPRPSPSGSLTADLLKKGAAWLRATGYRSGDLYVSAAVRRHLATHGGTAVGLEEKEAIRICRRGRGPPAGKQPVPYPTTHAGAFCSR